MREHHARRGALPELRVHGEKEGASFQVIVLVSWIDHVRDMLFRNVPPSLCGCDVVSGLAFPGIHSSQGRCSVDLLAFRCRYRGLC